MILYPEGWGESQRILVILAHPDDPEFFCGATIARWTTAGHRVEYCLLTRGDKGNDNPDFGGEQVARMREEEQRAAAAVLGVVDVRFLDYPDGYLVADIGLRREVVRVIRQVRPDILVTCDPTNLFPRANAINHADHRAAGQAVLDAYYPGAGNRMFFPELLEEGLQPHRVKELWLASASQPNVVLDVTDHWETKLRALHAHASQIGDPEKFDECMRARHTADSTAEAPRYEERFYRLIFD